MYNEVYLSLLEENQAFHKRVTSGKDSYNSVNYKQLQRELLAIEKQMTAKEIIDHAAYLFPQVTKV